MNMQLTTKEITKVMLKQNDAIENYDVDKFFKSVPIIMHFIEKMQHKGMVRILVVAEFDTPFILTFMPTKSKENITILDNEQVQKLLSYIKKRFTKKTTELLFAEIMDRTLSLAIRAFKEQYWVTPVAAPTSNNKGYN